MAHSKKKAEPADSERHSSAPLPQRALAFLGPGLVTGAADDDPSGIATYSQAGAQFGFSITWTLLFTYPLMTVIQEISARIGRTTGKGIGANLRLHYSPWLLYAVVFSIIAANTINIAADLGAMGDATNLVLGGPKWLYVVLFGVLCAALQVFIEYSRYAAILKWLTVVLFAYFGTFFVLKIPWAEAARGLFIPTFSSNADFWTTVVAIFGTTISPYLFFWQASQEVEEIKDKKRRKPLVNAPQQGPAAVRRIEADTYIGMAFSNLVSLAIMITTAATLHAAGTKDVASSAQAAAALKPVAGEFGFLIFALGIIGTGLLAVPVLAGSSGYALGEARKWPVGLERKPRAAKAFYATIVISTMCGISIVLSPLDPMKALYWSAVVNGFAAAPVMAMMMLIVSSKKIMKKFAISGALYYLGWIATAAMGAAALGMIATSIAGGGGP